MSKSFTAEFFRDNRARLRTLFAGTAPIVITSNGLLQKSADTAFPFRQDSNFWYLTGISEPDVLLVMDKEKEYLIVPDRSSSRETFDGSVNTNVLSAISGVENVLGEKEGNRLLNSRLKKAKHVATFAASPAFIKAHGMYVNPARATLISKLKSENENLELLDLRQHLTRMRMIKHPAELSAIQEAVNITSQAFAKMKRSLPQLKHEFEVEALATGLFRKNGLNHAYSPIVAAGSNACTLHYINNDGDINPNDLVLIDIGCELQGYAADISRTYATGEVSKRQQQLWQTVIDVQDFAKDLLKPGVIISEYEKKIEKFMGEKLRELGLIKIIEHDTVRSYFPHATSHFLGLDVHDTADYDRPLESGMVLTVEPGIYIPEEGVGIRVEDNVVITDDGMTVLSGNLSTAL